MLPGVMSAAGDVYAQWRDDWLPRNWTDGASTRMSSGTGYRTGPRNTKARAKLYEALDAKLFFDRVLASEETLEAMQLAIGRYRRIVAKGGWPTIAKSKGAWLRLGSRESRVGLLRKRLAASGDLKKPGRSPWLFDRPLEAALKRFQIRHGLRPNGVVDNRTLAALNVPASERLAQLQVNRLRLHAFQERLAGAERYVLVNVPAFQLQAVRNGRVEIISKVIVGKSQTQTPTVEAKIRGLNFFPFWRVPDSIAHRALIPTILKDPDYLKREHIRVLTHWGGEEVDPAKVDWKSPDALKLKFRQDQGEFNALGLVRLDMPNDHIVYLHDTPLKRLFGSSGRAYSAGCVRVKRVLDLATWLVEGDDPEWNRARIDSVLMGKLAEDVKLKTPVPVMFVYITAWASDSGRAYFRPDIYGWDGTGALLAQYEDQAAPKQTLAP